LCTISDENDQWTLIDIINNPYIRLNYMFRFSLFQKIGKDTFLSAVKFKYPWFGCLAMEGISIIDTAKKTITPLPMEIEKWTYFIKVSENDIHKHQGKITINCDLTDDIGKYVSGFDSWHDSAESRTHYGPHYSADCEIDIEKWTMRKVDLPHPPTPSPILREGE
jgi:hypothetical protein